MTGRIKLVFLLLALTLTSHAALAEPDEEEASAAPKNLKVLKGKSREQLKAIMKSFTEALGVKCNHCHAKVYASDEKKEKLAAREMIQMTIRMNKEFPQVKKKATCFQCHRGETEPSKAESSVVPLQ